MHPENAAKLRMKGAPVGDPTAMEEMDKVRVVRVTSFGRMAVNLFPTLTTQPRW